LHLLLFRRNEYIKVRFLLVEVLSAGYCLFEGSLEVGRRKGGDWGGCVYYGTCLSGSFVRVDLREFVWAFQVV